MPYPCNLANIRVDQQIAESALNVSSEGASIGLELADHPRIGTILAINAKLALLEKDYSRAVSLLGASEEYHRAHSPTITPGLRDEMKPRPRGFATISADRVQNRPRVGQAVVRGIRPLTNSSAALRTSSFGPMVNPANQPRNIQAPTPILVTRPSRCIC